ncbi:unnamed protein product [Parajaminaea phylloscopi]
MKALYPALNLSLGRRTLVTNAARLRTPPKLPSAFVLQPEVEHALRSSRSPPVVALESTIITHGLPYDTNLEVGRRCEKVIRDAGAIPATIALVGGKIHVGLSDSQLQQLSESAANSERPASSIKTGRRDVPYVLSSKKVGGTTVSATAMIASLAGIDFFATGGIGGVHRGAETTFDVSSDLTTLAQYPINLFCSGAKSILSLPLTLEYLETQNVPVYSFGPKGQFPAFYTSRSGLYATPVESDEAAAQLIWTAKNIVQQQTGSIFAVPIPAQYEEDGLAIQANVEQAVKESIEQGVSQRGKEVTPWLLQRVSELSRGSSLKSNEALVVNNSATAARVAVKHQQLQQETEDDGASWTRGVKIQSEHSPSVVLLGCAALDVTASTDHPLPGATSEGTVQFALGGVARNMAAAAQYSLAENAGHVKLVAPLLDDAPGLLIRRGMAERGLSTEGFYNPPCDPRSARSTPVASLLLEGQTNDLSSGVTAMSLVEETLTGEVIRSAVGSRVQVVGFDANLTTAAMESLLECKTSRHAAEPLCLVYEPTTVYKSVRAIEALVNVQQGRGVSHAMPLIDVTTPNIIELEAMATAASAAGVPLYGGKPSGSALDTADALVDRAVQLATPLLSHIGLLLVTVGPRGVICVFRDEQGNAIAHHERPSRLLGTGEVKSTTGAGDCFAGAVIAALATERAPCAAASHRGPSIGWSLERVRRLARLGSLAALRSLTSHETVPAPRADEGGRWNLSLES